MTRTLRDELRLAIVSIQSVEAKLDLLTSIEPSDYRTKHALKCAAVDLRTGIVAATDALQRVCVRIGEAGE